jgi:magnesium-transporting ATPase (P-type)
MSVIVRDRSNNKIFLYTKGADSIIEKRMAPMNKQIKDRTWDLLQNYANIGLRTLLLAMREIPEQEFNKWKSEY